VVFGGLQLNNVVTRYRGSVPSKIPQPLEPPTSVDTHRCSRFPFTEGPNNDRKPASVSDSRPDVPQVLLSSNLYSIRSELPLVAFLHAVARVYAPVVSRKIANASRQTMERAEGQDSGQMTCVPLSTRSVWGAD
jgi:hypothetical protein